MSRRSSLEEDGAMLRLTIAAFVCPCVRLCVCVAVCALAKGKRGISSEDVDFQH